MKYHSVVLYLDVGQLLAAAYLSLRTVFGLPIVLCHGDYARGKFPTVKKVMFE